MIFKLIAKFLFYNKLRSGLVVLSVFVSSLFFLGILGFGNAAKEILINNLNRLSSDIILIIPLAVDSPIFLQRALRTGLVSEGFKESDLREISNIPGIKNIYKATGYDAIINTRKDEFRLQIFAIEESGLDLLFETAELQEGKPELSSGEVLVGGGIADRYDLRIGESIRINNRSFRIAGIFKKVGPNLFNLDNGIFLIYDDLIRIANLDQNRVYSMALKFDSSAYNESQIRDQIYQILDRSRKIRDPEDRDYSLLSGSSVSAQISILIDAIRFFFLAIASISVVVSLINLTNNLYIFISERYKQLATLKVLGANNSFQAILIIGISLSLILLGVIPTIIIITIISLTDLPFVLYNSDIIISISLLILATITTSYFPIRAVRSIEPAEALRYE
ncbi:MAG: ABC transporter permease [Candidatus Anstonellales archaeon]